MGPGQDGGRERRERQLLFWTVLGAIATVLTLLWTVGFPSTSDEDGTTPTLQPTPQPQAPAPTASRTTSPTVSKPPNPIVRRSGTVTMEVFSSIDLDSTAGNWGIGEEGSAGRDIRFSHSLLPDEAKEIFLAPGLSASYDSCLNATQRRTNNGFEFSEVKPG